MIHVGDCLEVMRGMAENSVDAIVTDPPYGLSFMGKRWDYDVPSTEIWAECLRVLKPGGHLLAFAGTRTQHRMAVRIEDAGFEIRDMIAWVYGSGFPKSLDVSKAIDKAGGQPWAQFAPMLDRLIKDAGYNYTSLDRALGIPSAGSNSCYWVRSDERGGLPPRSYFEQIKALLNPPSTFTDLYDKAEREVIAVERRKNAPSGIVGAGRESVEVERQITASATEAARQWEGWGTALKPSLEPITVARKPLIGTVATNVLAHGTGAMNIDDCGIGAKFSDGGRWPANLIHDGSDEVLSAFPDAKGQQARARTDAVPHGNKVYGALKNVTTQPAPRGDSGSAARFFYCAKATREDRNDGLEAGPVPAVAAGATMRDRETADWPARNGNHHPTVKPTDLMRYLCRLVTPRGGLVLDPFAGSGSTGRAALMDGFQFVGIELDPEYAAIAEARIRAVQPGLALGEVG